MKRAKAPKTDAVRRLERYAKQLEKTFPEPQLDVKGLRRLRDRINAVDEYCDLDATLLKRSLSMQIKARLDERHRNGE